MEHMRPIEWDQGTDPGIPGYRGQILYAGESCYVIATKVPPGVDGPARHTHASDQIYAVLEGTTTMEPARRNDRSAGSGGCSSLLACRITTATTATSTRCTLR